ncbi:uncharacterized protein LOC142802727 isoform X2 [Rhipicephalus microplus]
MPCEEATLSDIRLMRLPCNDRMTTPECPLCKHVETSECPLQQVISNLTQAHFEENSFEQNRADGWKKLKPNAVPTVFSFRPLPHHRKAPKERSGTALVSALDGGDVTIDGQAAAIGAMPSPGSLEPPEGQNRSSHETSSIAPVADETGLQGSSSGVQAGVSDPESANNSHAELNKQLADLTRKYSKLQELQTQANSTIQGFRKKVKKLESTIETLEKNMKFLNEDQIQALSRNSN